MLIGQSRFALVLFALALTAFSGTANAAATDLRLWVDVDGTAYLENTTDHPVSFDGYQIASEGKDLDPAGWDSISDRIPGRITELIAALGAGALTFGEANPSSANLAELNLGGVGTLAPKAKFSLGRPFRGFDQCPGLYWSAPGTGAQNSEYCIPEPSTWLLATLAGLALAGALRGRRPIARLWPSLLLLALSFSPSLGNAQVFRWSDGQVIPGTEEITLGPGVDLSGWNSEAHNLKRADFRGFDLSQADLSNSWLTSASFNDAVVRGANFSHTTGFEGVSSTASYQAKDLQGIGLAGLDLAALDFHSQNLTGADLSGANLTNADLAGANLTGAQLDNASLHFADLRGVQGLSATSDQTRNAVLPDGSIAGLDMSGQDRLVLKDRAIPIKIEDHARLTNRTSWIGVNFDGGEWDSPISFEPGIPVWLGNTLSLGFAEGIDPATQVGRAWDLFDWTGVAPTGQFTVASSYRWDLSQLYTTGEVTMLRTARGFEGDVNDDNRVDLADWQLIRANFGSIVPPTTAGDVDGSGWVDLTDAFLIKENFGNHGAVVPEPSTWLLAALAGLGVMRRRRL